MMEEKRQEENRKQEGAWKLMEALQKVPEELLERSEQSAPKVLEWSRIYRLAGVACVAVLVLGISAIGFRQFNVGNDSSGSVMEAMDTGNRAPAMEGAESENMMADGMVNSGMTAGTAEEEVLEMPESAPDKEQLQDSFGLLNNALVANDLKEMPLPEGFHYASLTVDSGAECETVDVTLVDEDARKIVLQVRYQTEEKKEPMSGGAGEKVENGDVKDNSISEQLNGTGQETDAVTTYAGVAGIVNIENVTPEWCKQVIEESGIDTESGLFFLEVIYPGGMTVCYKGIPDAEVMYGVLEAFK